MAGGFGGDDEDFENYENDDEEEYEDEDDDDEDEEDEDDDEEDDEDDEDGEEDKEDEENNLKDGEDDKNDNKFNQLKDKMLKWEEKRLRPKLNNLRDKLYRTQKPWMNFFDKKRLEKAKNNKYLKTDVNTIEMLIARNVFITGNKMMSTIAPAIPSILMGALILFLAVAVIAIIATLIGADTSMDGSGNGDGIAKSQFGASGKHFYGTRLIYKDDKKANGALLEEYVELVETSVALVQKQVKTITIDEETYNVEIELIVDLPSEDYDYSSFDATKEAEFKSKYADLAQIVGEMAGTVYKKDNGAEASADLVSTFEGIKYFGFDADLNTEISEQIKEFIKTKYTIKKAENTDSEGPAADQAKLKEQIDGTIDGLSLLQGEKYTIRTEKLFVKDYIFESDDDMMQMGEEDYVMMMYLPKQNVTASYFSFNVTGENSENVKFILKNNGSEIALKKDDGMDLSDFGQTGKLYMLNSDDNLSVSMSATTLYDANLKDDIKQELKKGMSFIKLVRSDADYNLYFEQAEDGEFLTYKKEGVTLEFEDATNKFKFTDEVTIK